MAKRAAPKNASPKRRKPAALPTIASPWTVANAKARLSDVLEKARTEGPQVITRNGKEAAVVVGIEEWERKTKRKGTLADFLMNSPLRGSGIEIERSREPSRDIEL